jgi:hypothetical protein
MDLAYTAARVIAGTVLDVAPVLGFLIGFQLLVIRRPLPDLRKVLAGTVFVIVGLGLFLLGLEETLFPVGRLLARQLTDPELIGHATAADGTILWQQFVWVYTFAFLIGFSTTIAEPSLLAVALKANEVSGGSVHVWGLRVAVALGVAVGVALGCYRIVSGTPLHYFIIAGYMVVVAQTAFAPKLIVPLAYDSGGVTTSTVTVPLVTALGLGLAENIPGRSALLDGFGLVAFASLFPIMAVLAYGQLADYRAHRRKRVS